MRRRQIVIVPVGFSMAAALSVNATTARPLSNHTRPHSS